MAVRKKSKPPRTVPAQPLPERRRIRDLRPHPRQDEWFFALSESELRALADSLERDGLQHAIHILPSNIVLAGHQRLSAAKLLGWTTIDVIVRHDLAGDEAAAAMFALTDNLRRRQLGPLELAGVYRALQEVERGKEHLWYSGEKRMDLRDRLAQHLGKSGRQLDRYVKLLELPATIRLAISQRRLPVVAAEKLFRLAIEEREAAAAAVANGEDPRAVVERLVPGRPKQPRLPRFERPGTAAVRSDLFELLSVFSSGHFSAYIKLVEKQGGDNAAALEFLRRVENIAEQMHRRIGKFVEAARV